MSNRRTPVFGTEESSRAKARGNGRKRKKKAARKLDPEQLITGKLNACYDVLHSIYEDFEMIGERSASRVKTLKDSTVASWRKMMGSVSWDKFMKYKLAAFYAYHLNQSLPAKPEGLLDEDLPHILIGGGPGKMCRQYLRRNWVGVRHQQQKELRASDEQAQLAQEFLNSILNSKKAMPDLEEEVKDERVLGTVKNLTTERGPKPRYVSLPEAWGKGLPDDVDVVLTQKTIENQVRRTVRELFKDATYTNDDRRRLFMPSTSANYNFTRSKAGTLGFLFEESPILKALRRPGGYLRWDELELRLESLSEEEIAAGDAEGTVHVEEDYDRREDVSPSIVRVDDRELRLAYETLMGSVTTAALAEEARVKAIGLLEPLKVRTISKGPPETYFALRSIWKFVHSHLRKINQFKLIGQPDDSALLQEILGIPKENRDVFISGDYAAATDNLDPRLSEAVADELGKILQLTEDERTLFKRSLTGHVFEMDDGSTAAQKWGQLMGSITSFPVLCIVNAAVVRWAMELGEERRIPIRHAAMAINGDDVVCRTSKFTFQYYGLIAAFAGLELSVGKTFVSKYFFTINSRAYNVLQNPVPYEVEKTSKDGTISTCTRMRAYNKTKFINSQLVFGKHRNRSEAGGLGNLVRRARDPMSRANNLLKDAPERLAEGLYRKFLKWNKDEFEATRLPWFMPAWIGGLGLPAPYDWTRSSELDLKIARCIILNWNKPGKKPGNMTVESTPWFIRQLVSKRLPKPTVTEDLEATGISSFERFKHLATINLLFDSNVDLKDMFREQAHTPASQILRHNRKLWDPRRAARRGLGKPLDESLLLSVLGKESLACVFQTELDENPNYVSGAAYKFLSTPRVEPSFENYWQIEPTVQVPYTGPSMRSIKEREQGLHPRVGPWVFPDADHT